MQQLMSKKDLERLEVLEGIINSHLEGFIATGAALNEIKTMKLYRETHDNFKDYVFDVFGVGIRYALYKIEAFKITLQLENVPKSIKESHVRPLSKVPQEKRKDVFKRAIEIASGGEQLKAAHVIKAVEETVTPPPEIITDMKEFYKEFQKLIDAVSESKLLGLTEDVVELIHKRGTKIFKMSKNIKPVEK